MGRVSAPRGSLVYVDANVIIYTVERIEPYSDVLDAFWQDVSGGTYSVCTSILTVLETLVRPLRARDDELVALFRQLLFYSPDLRLVGITGDIVETAARLRAHVAALKTPDALHAATALHVGADVLVTNDLGFKQAPDLSVIVLRDLLSS